MLQQMLHYSITEHCTVSRIEWAGIIDEETTYNSAAFSWDFERGFLLFLVIL
jgi:hypothetical protein